MECNGHPQETEPLRRWCEATQQRHRLTALHTLDPKGSVALHARATKLLVDASQRQRAKNARTRTWEERLARVAQPIGLGSPHTIAALRASGRRRFGAVTPRARTSGMKVAELGVASAQLCVRDWFCKSCACGGQGFWRMSATALQHRKRPLRVRREMDVGALALKQLSTDGRSAAIVVGANALDGMRTRAFIEHSGAVVVDVSLIVRGLCARIVEAQNWRRGGLRFAARCKVWARRTRGRTSSVPEMRPFRHQSGKAQRPHLIKTLPVRPTVVTLRLAQTL